jgi:hypothetical protein
MAYTKLLLAPILSLSHNWYFAKLVAINTMFGVGVMSPASGSKYFLSFNISVKRYLEANSRSSVYAGINYMHAIEGRYITMNDMELSFTGFDRGLAVHMGAEFDIKNNNTIVIKVCYMPGSRIKYHGYKSYGELRTSTIIICGVGMNIYIGNIAERIFGK